MLYTTPEMLRFGVTQLVRVLYSVSLFSLGFTVGAKLIAGAAFFRENGVNCEVAFASEDPRWLNREKLRLLFEYPFHQLKLRRLTAIADSTNHASLKLIEALGFEHEATLLRAAPNGDLIVYRMFEDLCPWLSRH